MATFEHILDAKGPDMMAFTIHVISAVPSEYHDEEDLDDAGACIKEGRYLICFRPSPGAHLSARNRVLEIFHALEVIADPDNYKIVVSVFSPKMDLPFVRRLGSWQMVSRHPVKMARIAA